MSPTEELSDSTESTEAPTAAEGAAEQSAERLDIEVKVGIPSTCLRHVTVVIPRKDIERYFDKILDEVAPKSEVPGFRTGRAPRKLVQQRFRKQIRDQVRAELIKDGVAQAIRDQELPAICEPDLDVDAVVLLDEGPMTLEFKLEVRPSFDLPQWKGLSIERPMREITDQDVDRRLEQVLSRYGRLVPYDGPAETGDYITCNLAFRTADGELSKSREEVIRVRPVLSFRDGKIEQFDKLMHGVRGGETRQGEAHLSMDAPNVALRGKTVLAVFEVLEVKKLELPKLTPSFLHELGEFKSVEELREVIEADLERQFDYFQRKHARRQITAQLTAGANWELPSEMLRRQSRRELERAVLELRREGFSEAEIRAHENELRQNSAATTALALKEHFILERIAEEESIQATEEDYNYEIAQIARQSGKSPRRVRARLEKGGLFDALHNQIVERQVIDLVLSHARFKDVPYVPEGAETEALDKAAGGGEEEQQIPEATQPDEAQPLKSPTEHS